MAWGDGLGRLKDGFRDVVGGAADMVGAVVDAIPGVSDVTGFLQSLPDHARDLFEGAQDKAIEAALGALPAGAINLSGQGALAKVVQQGLNALGHNVGAVDGVPGQGTLKAINSFLKEQGMDAIENISDFKGPHLATMVGALSKAGQLDNLRAPLLAALARYVPEFDIPGMSDIRDVLTSIDEKPSQDLVASGPPPTGFGMT